jgi:hypothetical protein
MARESESATILPAMAPPKARPAFFTRHGCVPLYVPNLIGE